VIGVGRISEQHFDVLEIVDAVVRACRTRSVIPIAAACRPGHPVRYRRH